MRIALINTNTIKPPIAPIGMDYLAESLAGCGIGVDILDLCLAEDPGRELESFLKGLRDPVLIGISIRNTDDCFFGGRGFFLPEVRGIIAKIKDETRVPIVLGGVGFSVMPDEIMEFCGADFGIWGEGEWALPRLAEALAGDGDPASVPGLIWRSDSGLLHNPPSFGDLSKLPPMSRSWIDNPRYFREGGQGGFESKRGCDRRCIYCADPVAKGRRIRVRPPKAVADEVRSLLEQGVDYLHTCDSEFNIPEGHARAVCEELIREGLGERVRWYAYCSPSPFSEELARLMRRAGCVGINFGVDSGDDGMLRRLGRDFSGKDLMEVARICRENGISSMFDLLLGGPGETIESVRKTLSLVRDANPDCIGVSIGVRVYPGTPLFHWIQGMIRDGSGNGIRRPVDYEGIPDFLAPTFYLSPALGDEIFGLVREEVEGDPRFFFSDPSDPDRNYNYVSNDPISEAIKEGYRGAYWDILRRKRAGAG
jgi:hypothetical protein